jgi:hypothetical protein
LETTRLEEEAVIKDLKRKNDVTDWYRSLLIEKVSEYDGLVDLNTYVRDDLLVKSKADQRKRAATSKVYVQAQTLYMRVKRTSDTINAASVSFSPPDSLITLLIQLRFARPLWSFTNDLCILHFLQDYSNSANHQHGVLWPFCISSCVSQRFLSLRYTYQTKDTK